MHASAGSSGARGARPPACRGGTRAGGLYRGGWGKWEGEDREQGEVEVNAKAADTDTGDTRSSGSSSPC